MGFLEIQCEGVLNFTNARASSHCTFNGRIQHSWSNVGRTTSVQIRRLTFVPGIIGHLLSMRASIDSRQLQAISFVPTQRSFCLIEKTLLGLAEIFPALWVLAIVTFRIQAPQSPANCYSRSQAKNFSTPALRPAVKP